MALRFLIDHCVPRSVETALRVNGYGVNRLTSVLPANATDDQVLREAVSNGRILITTDHDYGDIVRYPPASHDGIIVLLVRDRPEVLPVIVSRLLTYLGDNPDYDHYKGLLFLIEPHRIRIRS